jgi:hypothetical protein
MKNLITYKDWLFESYYDTLSSNLTGEIISKWVSEWKSGKKHLTYLQTIEDKIEFDIECNLFIDDRFETFECLDSTGADANDEDEDGDYVTPYMLIDFGVNPNALPGYWQEIYLYMVDTIRHEMEHITQGGSTNYKSGKPSDDDSKIRALIAKGKLPRYTYLLLPKEVDANLQGLRIEHKKRREPYIDTIMRYLHSENIEKESEIEEILTKWRERAKQIGGIPKF